jgi:hypothetical protein
MKRKSIDIFTVTIWRSVIKLVNIIIKLTFDTTNDCST